MYRTPQGRVRLNGTPPTRLARYAVAIFDYQMQGMDGVEVYRRAKEQRPEVLGVLLTAFATIDTVYPAIVAGFARVLAKPVDARVLIPHLAAIDRRVGRKSHANR